jgi:septal ring factor EnvC (AmiA/AmiB activator)
MPIEWTEKKTEETRKQLRVAPIVRAMAMGGITFASADTHPATLDDLSAAIRGMTEADRSRVVADVGVVPCNNCVDTLGNALESANAEVERLLSCKKDQASLLRQQRDELQDSEEQIRTLNERLEARNQELDNQKAEIDRLKANQIPVEVEPEWVRRMPEWMKEGIQSGLHDYATNLESPDLAKLAALEAVHAMGALMHKQNDAALPHLRNSSCYSLRAAYLARKAGGE